MTGNIVKLVFQSVAQGSGFAKVSAETAELRKNLGLASGAIGQLSQAFGTIGRLAGGAVSDLLRGNIWSLAARSCGFLIDKIKEHNKLMKDAALAARGLSREYMTLEYAQAELEKTRLEERRNEIRNNGAKAIKEIEDKIVAAKEEAARLEENAAKARGVGFGDWMREGRNEDRANRTEARRQENREKQVSQELDRLEKTNPRTRTRWQNERIAKLREWQADQDPANNPALNKVKQIQAQKDKIQEDMLTELQKISAALDAATTL